VACILLGFYFLLIPAYRLYRWKNRHHAWSLFKKSSYYPLALLILVTVRLKT
jgi:heme O synthase-like polyprenyltransferase